MNVLFDGPADVAIKGENVTLVSTSGGKRMTMTVSMQDALITMHRLQAAYAARTHGEVVQVDFTKQRHAETA